MMSSPGIKRRESATPGTRHAYNKSAPSSTSIVRHSDPTFVVGDASATTSPTGSDFRLSAISCASTVNLVHSEKRDETSGRPSMRNYPSSAELPTHICQLPRDYSDPGSKGKEQNTTILQGWRIIVFGSWFNLLLFLIPVSWALSSILGNHDKLVFIFCILSMIPLVKLHDLAMEELALRVGGAKTGLLNASMSNTVEVVVAITALRKCELRVVQASLIGSVLSKLLLILGMCFFAGGLKFSEQGFDQTATQVHTSLLSISVGVLLLPAAYHFALDDDGGEYTLAAQKKHILKMSHGVSIVLMTIYLAYLVFQCWSHTHLYEDVKQQSDRLPVKVSIGSRILPRSWRSNTGNMPPAGTSCTGSDVRSSMLTSTPSSRKGAVREFSHHNSPFHSTSETTLTNSPIHKPGNITSMPTNLNPTIRLVPESLRDGDYNRSDPKVGLTTTVPRLKLPGNTSAIIDDTRQYSSPEPISAAETPPSSGFSPSAISAKSSMEPRLSWTMTILLLILITIAVAFNADDLVESMNGISGAMSKQWIGLILLPAVSSITECVTAMNISVKDQLSLSISVAVNSTIQTTLFVIPLMVTLGWAIDRPLALLFDPFESVVLYIAVQTTSHVIADGKSNWLEGTILICLYIIIAVSFWYYPDRANELLMC
ncbi:hypothetical protein EDC04DRAFT_959647 [Pisolithus marmoratus]|nr:hypothetical protein EDC04DRAFT_959647 [Pisolithus marmoratus]